MSYTHPDYNMALSIKPAGLSFDTFHHRSGGIVLTDMQQMDFISLYNLNDIILVQWKVKISVSILISTARCKTFFCVLKYNLGSE